MKRTLFCAALILVALTTIVPGARAHGGLEASNPEDGASLEKRPRRVTMTFNEVPSDDSVMKVVDGCKRNVVASTSVRGNDLVGALGDAQPGKWKASYRVISAEDGHLTKGTLRFTVAGKRDCTPDDGTDETEAPEGPSGGGSATPPGDDGSSFPVVPVAVGAAGLLVVGLVVRRVSAG
jgi:methionine-rich copper-binding protein CopC